MSDRPVDVLSEPLVTATVTTHDPSKYTLHNSEDGTVWQMGDDGRWKRATPDNAGRSPIDVETLARAMHNGYEGEPCANPSCPDIAPWRRDAANLATEYARLSESTGSTANDELMLHTQEADANGVWCREDGQRWPCDAIRLSESTGSEEGR